MNGKRVLAVMVGVVLSVSFLASCSDDDDASPEEAFCNAGDDLRADVASLTDLDLVADGTNVLEALEAAGDELGSAIDGLGDEITVDNVGATLDAVGAVGGAASAVFADLSSTCS
jgi:hypothetical protein